MSTSGILDSSNLELSESQEMEPVTYEVWKNTILEIAHLKS